MPASSPSPTASISGGGKKVSYGELIGGKSFAIKLDPKQPVKEKEPKDYKIVGKSQARWTSRTRSPGASLICRTPACPACCTVVWCARTAIGAKLEAVDESALKKIPGIVKVVREGNFLAVVAANEWDAVQAAPRLLKATWSKSETLPEQAKLWEHVRATKVVKDEVTSNAGNTAEAMAKEGAKTVKATYDFAIHTHGSIGPSCAIAEFKDGSADVLVGLAGDPCAAQAAGADVRHAGREGALHICRGLPAVTAATATRTPPPTPLCWRRRWASQCACSGRVPTSTAGTRRARRL